MQGDQPFHGSLTEARGLGRYLGIVGSAVVTPKTIASAIVEVREDEALLEKAAEISELVRAENGVARATEFIDAVASEHSYPWPTVPAGGAT
jgi:UDP:flavonoid glycosyltransferase YjiC (YdhE family)